MNTGGRAGEQAHGRAELLEVDCVDLECLGAAGNTPRKILVDNIKKGKKTKGDGRVRLQEPKTRGRQHDKLKQENKDTY